jgi:hypothetical protein
MKKLIGNLSGSVFLMCFLIGIFKCHGTIIPDNSSGVEPVSGNQISKNVAYVNNTIDTLLGLYVTTDRGLVDYDGIWKDSRLASVIDTIAFFDLGSLSSPQDSLAFWINAYNMYVIYYLKKDFNLARQDKIGFPLFSKKYRIARETISLDQLEKGETPERIKKFKDPRTHFALVCAALSCPPLMNRAYRGNQLYSILDTRTSLFINNRQYNPIPGVSMLFSWYGAEFAGYIRNPSSPLLLGNKPDGTIVQFIQSFLLDSSSIERAGASGLQYELYDWSINIKTP